MNIAIRVDAQLQRCLALAAGLAETDPDCRIFFFSSSKEPADAGYTSVEFPQALSGTWDAEETLEKIAENSIDLLVLDKEYDADSIRMLCEKVFVAIFDDSGSDAAKSANVVINPNINAHTLDYGKEDQLLGSDFAPLPPSFDEFQDFRREISERVKRIVVFFPGEDRKGNTLAAVKELKKLKENFSVSIIIARTYSGGERLAGEIGLDPRFIVMNEDELAKKLSMADLAISSTDAMNFLAALAIPSITIAENTGRPNLLAEYSDRSGFSLIVRSMGGLGPSLSAIMSDKQARDRMSNRLTDLVDCMGRFRLADELLRIYREKRKSL